MSYTVNLWSTHPDLDNDDCTTGDDFFTLAEALACAENAVAHFDLFDLTVHEYIEIDGIDYHEDRKNPVFDAKKASRLRRDEGAEWRSERAMQAGMAFGVQGYNDEMGYDSEEVR